MKIEQASRFIAVNHESFNELLTFIDFSQNLTIGFVAINFITEIDYLITALKEQVKPQEIQLEILDFSEDEVRFLLDEILLRLSKIKIVPQHKLVIIIRGLEKSIGVSMKYPPILIDLNFVRDAYRTRLPHPLIFILPDYALTRIMQFAPDFWAWRSGTFRFQTTQETKDLAIKNLENYNFVYQQTNQSERQERINLLERLLMEYYPLGTRILPENLKACLTILNQLGIAYLDLGNPHKSQEYLAQALQLVANQDNLYAKAEIYINLGNTYYSLGEYQKALEFHQQSLAITREIGERRGEASSYNNLGNTYYSLGEYQKAIEFYQQSLAITREIGDRGGEANSYCNLGNVYGSLGEYQKASEFHQQSLAIFREIGDRGGEATAWFNLGFTYDKLDRIPEAKEAYLQSRELSQALGLDAYVQDCDDKIQQL